VSRAHVAAVTLALLLVAAPARAERPLSEMTLEELLQVKIRVASTRPEDTFSTPSTVSVIDRATIELYGLTSIEEALSTVAGVAIHRTFETRDLPIIRGVLQDHATDKVLILINGVPSWMAVTGHGALDAVSLDDVERIEVLRGPASVLYGTNAYAGAINLVLRHPSHGERHAQVRVRAGLPDAMSAGATASTTLEGVDVLVSANGAREATRPFTFVDERGESGLITDFDQGNNGVVTARYDAGGDEHTAMIAAYQRRESYLGAVPDFQHGAGNPQDRDGLLAHYGASLALGERLRLLPEVTYDLERRESSRIDDDSVRTRSVGWRGTASLRSQLTATPWLELELGAELEYRRSAQHADHDTRTDAVLVDNNMTGRHVTEGSVYAQADVRGDRLDVKLPARLLVGARYTNNQLFASNLSLRSTLLVPLADRQAIKLVFGQAFRAPTLFELYFQTPFATQSIYGNPDLNPETSTSVEASYQLATGPFHLQALGYHATYADKIFLVRRDPTSATDLSLIYANGQRFAAWGAELELRVHDPDLGSAFVDYTMVYGDDHDQIAEDPGHYNFKYIPHHMATFGVARTFDGFSAATIVHVIGPRGAPLERLATQATWDVSLGYRTGSARHTIAARNLLNDDILIPDYVRRNLNAYPQGHGRLVMYMLEMDF